ncbi:LysM peptidoglycan-binding domain-containing protein [Sporosarcina sp. CAU 1771]
MKVHIVVRGDTLWKISRQYGIPFEELKRVNAHLANPDYIVPGMKIFLPAMHHGGKEPSKGGVQAKPQAKPPVKTTAPTKGEQKPKPPVSKPVHSTPPPVVSKPTPPAQPIPVRPVPQAQPTPPAQPIPVPPIPHAQPRPAPPVPQAQPMPPTPQQMPMQPCVHPIFAVPCGWMPIYDADCYPFMHPGQMQHVPMPAAPPPVQAPMQRPPMRAEESPGPVSMPEREKGSVPYGWKILESPEMDFDESPLFTVPRPQIDQESPKVMESTNPMQQPQVQPYAGMCHMCGCSPCRCMQAPPNGYGGYQAMPTHSQLPSHVQMHFCNACHQPVQQMPFHMMPYSQQGQNWPGSY